MAMSHKVQGAALFLMSFLGGLIFDKATGAFLPQGFMDPMWRAEHYAFGMYISFAFLAPYFEGPFRVIEEVWTRKNPRMMAILVVVLSAAVAFVLMMDSIAIGKEMQVVNSMGPLGRTALCFFWAVPVIDGTLDRFPAIKEVVKVHIK